MIYSIIIIIIIIIYLFNFYSSNNTGQDGDACLTIAHMDNTSFSWHDVVEMNGL